MTMTNENPQFDALTNQYRETTQALANLEAQAEEVRTKKATIAKSILDAFGSGPHTIEGKRLVVMRSRGGGHFLREPATGPRGPRKPKVQAEPETSDEITSDETTETTDESTKTL